MNHPIQLPPMPRQIPPLTVDPAGIRTFVADLLVASANIDDLGTFVAGSARLSDWTGQASTAYHQAIQPTGHTADAMSLALRGVSQRSDAHADTMQSLVDRREAMVTHRSHLVQTIEALTARARTATEDERAAIQAECDDCTREVRGYESDLDTWVADIAAEEQAMVEAFNRVLDLEQVERRYGGVADPADAALGTKPGPDASPEEVNAWWDGLTSDQQQAIMAAAPGSIGNLDGIPAEARSEANHVALSRDLGVWELLEERGDLTGDEEHWLENARAARDAIETIELGVDPVTGEPLESQLYIYDPTAFDGDGRVAVSAGNLDTADNVSVTVPGFGTDAESATYQAHRSLNIYESTRFLDPNQTSASMFWIGYDAPDNLPWDEGWDAAGVITEGAAEEGGAGLADTLDGLGASRDGEPAHLTAIGHSYGSTTTGIGAHEHGLPVNDLVFVGSPGVGGDTNNAGDTGVDPDHVWAGANSRDPITYLGNHGWMHGETLFGTGLGDDPAEDDFGANRFQAEDTSRAGYPSVDQHSLYFDHNTESLYNIAQIVNGDYDAVMEAEHIYDPWYAGVQDPELDRDPATTMTEP